MDTGHSEELPWPDRAAGVLLHPTSLPGPYGCGDLGDEARRFVDLLVEAGQTTWQILPLATPGPGASPYAGRSVFAGNPALVSLDRLAEDGLLDRVDLESPPAFSPERIDFAAVEAWRAPLLRGACERFLAAGRGPELDTLGAATPWLDDYALFIALSDGYAASWVDWPAPLAKRDEGAVHEARHDFAAEIRYQQFLQYQFDRQWRALRAYARERGVRIFGDIPIFPAYDSADVWANQRLFKLDATGHREVVAGVPPDAFSATGQHWGNPLYRWDVLAAEGYRWWVERLRHAFDQADTVRIDHFRGFQAAWEIPADHPTAEHGTWVPGPGRAFFDAVAAQLGRLPIVVEDLGMITRDVRALRDGLGFPGMAVLQFAFGDDASNPYLPHNVHENTVIYTGTHDNDTTLGWFHSLGHRERDNVLRYLARDGSDIVSDLVRLAFASTAKLAIVPMQDVLGLDSDARTNVPGTALGNWNWRFRWDQVDSRRLDWLRETARTYGRSRP